MSLHSFDPQVAELVGVNAAVLHQNMIFWAQKNEANEKHIMDGRVWTYNSRRAFARLFPYFTDSQIKTAISKLIDAGLLIKGDYNKARYDRTCWYSPVPIGQKSPMEWAEITNGLVKNRQPIPDSKPDSKPDGKQEYTRATDPDLFSADEKPVKPKTERLPQEWIPSDTDIAAAKKLNLADDEIREIADDFRTYWTERTDKGSRKTQRGWAAAWRNNCNRLASQYHRNRRISQQAQTHGYRQGSDIASIAARRRLDGQV